MSLKPLNFIAKSIHFLSKCVIQVLSVCSIGWIENNYQNRFEFSIKNFLYSNSPFFNFNSIIFK